MLVLAWIVGLMPSDFALTKAGKPVAVIALPPDADTSARRAAEILSSSVEKMTGTPMPILTKSRPGADAEVDIDFPDVQVPGSLRSKPLQRDGFAIWTAGTHLFVRSGGRKGSIYAVVDLLERRFGCRCFSPTAWRFPHDPDLSIKPILEVDNPFSTFRCVNGDFAIDEDYLDWQRLSSTAEVFGNGYYVHTFRRLVPPETYFATHPEYFALVDGRRTQEQLCPSRPENVDIVVAKLKQEMAAQPGKKVWSVSQNDNQTYCQCPECTRIMKEEGSPSGPLLRFVNAVARHFPDKTISTLAYEFSRPAPRVTKPDPNVQIMLCTIEMNRGKPIADDPGSADFRKDISSWSRICKNLYLWDYTVNFSHQVSPFPNLAVLAPNVRFFADHGVRQQFQQTNTSPGHEFSELKGYVEARLLWNPYADPRPIVADFLGGYYGAAAPWIQRYIDALEDAQLKAGHRLDIFENPNAHRDDYLSAENLAVYNSLFDQAEAAVRGDPNLLQRVRTARLPIEYATIAIAGEHMFGPRGFFAAEDENPQLKPEMKATLDDFYATCVRNHVRSVNESNLTPKQFYEASLRLTDLQIQGNLAFRKTVRADPPPSPKYGDGDLHLLTNGVLGGSDFKVQWLGWEGEDISLDVDLGVSGPCHEASIDTISVWRSWILHPARVACLVSDDGTAFREVGSQTVPEETAGPESIRTFRFEWPSANARYVRFLVEGTKKLPAWHPAPGAKSWVFVDELIVR